MTRRVKIAIVLLTDSVLIMFANLLTRFFLAPFVAANLTTSARLFLFQWGVYILLGIVFRVFSRVNRYTSLNEMVAILAATTGTYIVEVLFFSISQEVYSQRYVTLTFLLSTFFIISSRLTWRIFVEYRLKDRHLQPGAKQTLVVGAGDAGVRLVTTLHSSKVPTDMLVVGFVDDDLSKRHAYIANKRILGTTAELPDLIDKYQIDMVTIAIPTLDAMNYRRIVDILAPLNVMINTMPPMEELAKGNLKVSKMRDVDVIDLLGRDEVQLDNQQLKKQISGKKVLVTGAGGSIGSEITRQIMQFKPKQVLLLGHGENSIYQIHRELTCTYKDQGMDIIPLIADIQDRKRIEEVMAKYRPDFVYHAAAHKHVPMMECNPREAIKNNVFGTKNVAELAKKYEVSKFVMISTDKAVNPPNVMGATKRIAEIIVTSLNEPRKTIFSAVRFGNVLGSRGSVVPLFKEQIAKGGPVSVTDFRMTRYFMTIPEASRLVLQAGALAKGAEIFILDMGEPVKIYDLAKQLVRLSGYQEDEIKIIETGIRPGEKLYEELLVSKERNHEQVHEKIFVGSVNGFAREKVLAFLEEVRDLEDQELAKEVVRFANESSK